MSTVEDDGSRSIEERAEAVADVAKRRHLTIAVAESLTAGAIVSALGKAGDAGQWLAGGATFDGSPPEVVDATVLAALSTLADVAKRD